MNHGKPAIVMKSRIAVSWESGNPLMIEDVEVQTLKKYEVLLRMVVTGILR